MVDTAGTATFTASQRRGIPSRFLYFPDESHWVLKPKNSIPWHDTVLDWLDQWPEACRTVSEQGVRECSSALPCRHFLVFSI